MTERELLEYVFCEREIEKLHRRYKEEEERMTLPRSSSMSGMPRGAGSDDPFLEILDHRTKLKERLDAVKTDRLVAERRLERAYAVLNSEQERDVFDELYRYGKRITDASESLHFSTPHIYRLRKQILSRIANVTA